MGTTPFTESQLMGLVIAETVSSALSLVGSIAVILVCFSIKNPDPNRMPGFLAISDLGLSITTVIGRAFINNPTGIPCFIQGWAVHIFFISTMLWNAAMAICVLLTLGAKWGFESLPKLYPWFHVIIWGLTFTIATTFAGLRKYGDALLWCWLPASESILRFAVFFDIIWACLAFNLMVYFYIGYELWKAERTLKQAISSSLKTPGAAAITHPHDDPVLKYAKRVSYFILGYIVVWVPTSLNRIQNSIPGSKPIFALFLLQAIFTPLEGITTFLIYFWRISSARRLNILKTRKASAEEQLPLGNSDREREGSTGSAPISFSGSDTSPVIDQVNNMMIRTRSARSLEDVTTLQEMTSVSWTDWAMVERESKNHEYQEENHEEDDV